MAKLTQLKSFWLQNGSDTACLVFLCQGVQETRLWAEVLYPRDIGGKVTRARAALFFFLFKQTNKLTNPKLFS